MGTVVPKIQQGRVGTAALAAQPQQGHGGSPTDSQHGQRAFWEPGDIIQSGILLTVCSRFLDRTKP